MTDLNVIEDTTRKTQEFINRVNEVGGFESKEKSLVAIRGAFRALRDRLPVELAAHIAGQLPILLTGFYYESWKPSENPVKDRSKDEFLNHINDYIYDKAPGMESEDAAEAVYQVLFEYISQGEAEDVIAALPPSIRTLWPESAQVLA